MSKPTEKPSPGGEPKTAGGRPTREEIEVRAHEFYVERGGAHGHDMDDWLQAERELFEKYQETGRTAKAAVV
ncbi:MAG: DUF2934 domain-containing protein [Candidatus Acidiferrales bacterium]